MDYTSPTAYSLSPVSRGAKRSRSRTFSNHEEAQRESLAALRTRGLSSGSTYLPTPPLSASSSMSSGSSFSSVGGHFPSFANLPHWRPESAGPPMAMHTSPEVYTPAPASDLDPSDARHPLTSLKRMSFNGKPIPAHVFHDPPPSATQGMLPTPIPLTDAAHFLAAQRAHDASALPPKAPLLELEGTGTLDAAKPWLQQEYVEGLIGVSMLAIESIWPLQTAAQKSKASAEAATSPPGSPDQVLPLKYFIQETLRRSRSTAVVLQVALYYLHKSRSRIRERVAKAEAAKERFSHLARVRQQTQHSSAYPTPPASPLLDDFTAAAADVLATSKDPVICGRRMFLAALITASKFLLDRTYSNRAWSRLSGLPVSEINANERAFLALLDYRLYIGSELMANWMTRLRKLQEQQGILPPAVQPRKGIERTQSENLSHLNLPIEEMRASFPHAHSSPFPAVQGSAPMPSIVRSQSSATLPSHFPDIDLNPRSGHVVSKPPLQRQGTLGLSRSSSLTRGGPAAHDFASSSPLRWSLPPSTRSCSVSSGLGVSDRGMAVQTAY